MRSILQSQCKQKRSHTKFCMKMGEWPSRGRRYSFVAPIPSQQIQNKPNGCVSFPSFPNYK